MLGRSVFWTKATLAGALGLTAVTASAADLQADLVAGAYDVPSASDRELAASIEAQASERQKAKSANPDWGVMVKLWCEAAVIAPNPKNLSECGRARFGSFLGASNPSGTVADQAGRSLAYARAALEVAGGMAKIDDDYRTSLRADAVCLRKIADGAEPPEDCRAPYR